MSAYIHNQSRDNNLLFNEHLFKHSDTELT